jgi:hypothetical protein
MDNKSCICIEIMQTVSRFFSGEDEFSEEFVKIYISHLLPRWTDLMRKEFPNKFIDTEIVYRGVKKPHAGFIGASGKGGLYADNLFFIQLREALASEEPKIHIHLGMYLKKGSGHANALLIDNRERTVSIFEPNGAVFEKYRDPGTILGNFVVKYMLKHGFGQYVLRPSNMICPYLGVQAREHEGYRERNVRGKGHGFCLIWSLMYIHYHLLNPEATHEEVQEAMMKNYSNQELERRAMRYTDRILKYVAGIRSPFDDDSKSRCMRFIRYFKQDEDSVLGMQDPITGTEKVKRTNREQIAEQCRQIITEDDLPEEEIEDYIELGPEEIGEDVFQFDDPDAAKCIRTVANVKEMGNEVKFDKQGFNPDYLKNNLSNISPKTTALLAKIEELDQADMVQHGKKFKHFIFSDIRQEGAKFLVGALLAKGFTNCFEEDRLELKSREEMMETEGENVIFLLSSAVFDKTFTVGLKRSVLQTFNSRPDNVNGELARIIVLDSGYKEGIDLFDVKYVHIFEPPTTRANLRQTIGRATRFCGQAGLPFVENEGWRLSVFLYDIEFDSIVSRVYRINRGEDIVKRFISSDHRVAEFETELENFCLEVSVDRDLNQFIHQQSLATQGPVHVSEHPIDPIVEVIEHEENIQLIPTIPPIKISSKASCGNTKATKGVPLSTGMFYLLAFCAGYIKTGPRGKVDNRELRAYLCELLKTESFARRINEMVNDPIQTIQENQEKLKEAFKKGGDFMSLKASMRNQMLKIVFQALEQGVIEELEKVRAKHRSRKHRRRMILPQVPGMDRNEIEQLPVANPPETKLSHEELKAYILDNYTHCTWPKPKIENQCIIQPQPDGVPSGPKVIKFTPTQEFIRTYFTPQNPYKGMLIQHGVGCGKTCTAIATATSTFDREGYKIIWVTRTSLKSDLYKNMFDLVCNLHVKEMIEAGKTIPADRDQQMKLLGKSWSIPPISYKQFSNLVEGKNELHNKLVKLNGQEDPLKKTLIIIDEAHKLYGGDDMSGSEKPNLEAFHDALMKSYEVSGEESARVLLMTATPYTSNPMEFFQLINLIREPTEQLPVTFDEVRDTYLDSAGKFTQEGREMLLNQLAGQISYLNRQNDVRQFAQVHTHHILVNQRNVTNQTLKRDIKHLEELLERLGHQQFLLEELIKVEKKKKVGRNKDAKETKEATLKRLAFELETSERRIDEVEFELVYYRELYQEGNVNVIVDYSQILGKRCFKKIGKEKKPRKKPEQIEDSSDEDSGTDEYDTDEED